MNDVHRPDLDEEDIDTNELRESDLRFPRAGALFAPADAGGTAGRRRPGDARQHRFGAGACARRQHSRIVSSADDARRGSDFPPVAKSLEDAVTLPRGTATTCCTRSAIRSPRHLSDFRNDGTDDAASFAHRAGDHHDGMHYFGLGRDGDYESAGVRRAACCA